MDIAERLVIKDAIEQLMVDFWHEVDVNHGANAHDYFSEDCVYTTSANTRRGRKAIQEFYRTRLARGPRISRHLISNHKIVIIDHSHARGMSVLSLFAADGVPILPSKPAIMVADLHDEIVRCDDDRWRYQSKVITPLFRGDTPTTA